MVALATVLRSLMGLERCYATAVTAAQSTVVGQCCASLNSSRATSLLPMWVRVPRDVGDPCTTRTLWCALAAENHQKILAPMPQYYLTLYHLRLCSNKCYRSRMYSRGPLVRFKVCLLYHIYGSFQDQLLDWGLQSFLGYRKFNYMGLILAIRLLIINK